MAQDKADTEHPRVHSGGVEGGAAEQRLENSDLGRKVLYSLLESAFWQEGISLPEKLGSRQRLLLFDLLQIHLLLRGAPHQSLHKQHKRST